MNRILMICLCAAVGAASCGPRTASAPSSGSRSAAMTGGQERAAVGGTIKGISDTHGNAYTSIAPDQYAPLGLTAGAKVRIHIGGRDLALPVVRDYADVPVGTAMAVLHREGLTLAIRDGNFSRTYGVSEGTPFTLSLPHDAGN